MTRSNLKPVALVSGGSGFIGKHLALRLVSLGWSVRLLVRDRGKLADSLARRCDVVMGSLADIDALCQAVCGVDVIFHCAANVNTWDTRDAYYASNVQGVRNLLLAISRVNPGLSRLLHVSTVDVYGFPEVPCGEDCVASAAGFGYEETKRLGESLLKEYCEGAKIPYTIIRPGNVIGPGSQFIARIGDALRSGVMLKVDGGCANAGLLYIDNLIDYMVWAARADASISECYNVRDAYDVSWCEFLDVFRKSINGKGVMINLPFGLANWLAAGTETVFRIFLPGKEPFNHRLLVHIFGRTCGHPAGKIRGHSGIVGKVGFNEAMERSVRWYIEQKSPR